ncbi:hypothetical protein [Chitinophaga sp.]|nr:hypothetical protein [Chitinophaga sp.]HWV66021.1 hypothetical protein [Chitinophaga sp.]
MPNIAETTPQNVAPVHRRLAKKQAMARLLLNGLLFDKSADILTRILCFI